MSKRSLFWGNASGKLGEAVYYRAGGEQRTRTWVPTIKNPRTNKQAVQRTKMNNMTAFYKSAANFIKQVLKPEKTSMSAFNQLVKNNATRNSFVASKAMIDGGYSVPLNFLVSTGDLNVPTRPDMGTGMTSIDLSGAGVDMWYTMVNNPYLLKLASPLPQTTLTGTTSETAAKQARGLLLGSEFYSAFVGAENPYGLPAEFALFIVVCQYADEGYVTDVLGVKCSASSADQLHVVISSGNSSVSVGDMDKWFLPANGTLTKGTASADAKLVGTTDWFLGSGSTVAPLVEDMIAGVCIAYRDDTGIHSSPCLLTTGHDGDTNYADQWLPNGDVGREIVSQYETASNTLV